MAGTMRRVAAEARRVLLELGGQHLAAPVEMLAVANATIALKSDPAKKVTYAELIGGKRFNVALTGRNVDATTGKAAVKPVTELRVVGPVAEALRHSRQGGRIVEVGRGHEAARHGPCAQCAAAVRGRDAAAHRRVVGGRRARASSAWSAAATMWR